MAIVHVAVHDAVSAVTGQYEQYKPTRPAPAGARRRRRRLPPRTGRSSESSATRRSSKPSLRGVARQRTASQLATPASPSGSRSPTASWHCVSNDGAAVAAYAVSAARRRRDRRVDTDQLRARCPGPAAGLGQRHAVGAPERVAVPAGSSAGAGEQTLCQGLQRDLLIGAPTSPARTEEQTQIALFWRASPTALWNPILRTGGRGRATWTSRRRHA